MACTPKYITASTPRVRKAPKAKAPLALGGEGVGEDVLAVHRDAARGGREAARDDIHGGTFPGAVRTEEADDLARLDGEADLTYSRPCTVFFR